LKKTENSFTHEETFQGKRGSPAACSYGKKGSHSRGKKHLGATRGRSLVGTERKGGIKPCSIEGGGGGVRHSGGSEQKKRVRPSGTVRRKYIIHGGKVSGWKEERRLLIVKGSIQEEEFAEERYTRRSRINPKEKYFGHF